MHLGTLVAELLALGDSGPPSAEAIERAFAARASKREAASGRPNGVVLLLQGDVAALTIWEDSRGWGAYAVLAVTAGSLVELESVVGATKFVPRNPDDFHSGETRAAYVTKAGKTIRVFAELDKVDARQVRRVTIHFQR